MMTEAQAALLARVKDAEKAVLEFADDWKFIPTLPRGPQGERAILMLDYLIPDLQHIVSAHYVSRGWRRHDDLAIVKPRKIVGGLFEDLVAYVPMDQPSTPIVVERPTTITDATPPDLDALPWSAPPVVNDVYEERPDDDE